MPASMTRKHFEALAAALKITGPAGYLTSGEGHQWRADVEQVADVCARFNPTFDRARFLAACGVQEN